jgi:transcriptional regulator with XRE-family HTH domain
MPNARPPRERQPALGEAIRRTRQKLGLTQEQLGLRADLHPTWISHMEAGNNPEWATIKRIARGLEISISELARLAEQIELE